LLLLVLLVLLELLHCWVLRALSFVSSKATQPDRFKTLSALFSFLSVFVFQFYRRGEYLKVGKIPIGDNSDWGKFRVGRNPILPQIDLLA